MFDSMGQVQEMVTDSMFKTVPKLFKLHLMFFGLFGDNFLPLFSTLMTGKPEVLYSAVLWENIMVRSLVPAYHNKELLFRKWVKSFFALPLLPNHKIEEGFGLLKSSRPQIHHDGVPLNTQVISFVVYYERFWMGGGCFGGCCTGDCCQEVVGQEAAAKKKFNRCAVCLQENISVTRPIYLVLCGHGDICKECVQKVSTKNCHLCRAEIFTFVQVIVND
ncbi:hypothetical protein E2C01_018015 [Portunus trituberculatus]|uniref:RING-type domain-containing protein n=1 Tax=Portunus trituberculatus TaxID=210409 RepID=A0A5B7DTF4_PORTR|nr:hypothetical protein [Portunus trituberculatus]